MRKALLFAPMLMFLLAACGGEGPDPVAELQRQYAAVESATMEADIVCHYEDEVREYTLLCAYTPEKSTVTVLAPDALSGISAAVENGTLTLSYDDLSLDAGVYSKATTAALVSGILGTLLLGIGMSLAMTDIGQVLGAVPAMLGGIGVGAVGIALVSLAYPIYNRTLKKERAKIAPEIIRLTDALMK